MSDSYFDPKLDPAAAERLAKTHSGREALAVIEKLKELLSESRAEVERLSNIKEPDGLREDLIDLIQKHGLGFFPVACSG